MSTSLGPPYTLDDRALIDGVLRDLVSRRSSRSKVLTLDREEILRQIGGLAGDYIADRRLECDRLLEIADEPLRREVEQCLREAWWMGKSAPEKPFMKALERAIGQLRDETRDRGIVQEFRRDLRSLGSNRLRLGLALTRPYADELVSALRVGAIKAGLSCAFEADLVARLDADRAQLCRAATEALQAAQLRNRTGPAGDDAALRFSMAINHLVRDISGRSISIARRTDSTRRQKHRGPGFRLLMTCLKPLKPTLTEAGVVGIVRTVRTIERRQTELHDNS